MSVCKYKYGLTLAKEISACFSPETQVSSQVCPFGFCGGRISTDTGISPIAMVLPSHFLFQMLKSLFPFHPGDGQ